MYHRLFIHSSTEGHLSCFQVMAIMDKAAIHISVQVFVWTCFQLIGGKYEEAQLAHEFSEAQYPPGSVGMTFSMARTSRLLWLGEAVSICHSQNWLILGAGRQMGPLPIPGEATSVQGSS